VKAQTLAILLRGVNVGGNNKLPMADLKRILADLGYADVKTLLNSGNAVLFARAGTPAAHAKKLRAAILERTRVDCEVVVKTADEIAATIDEHPLRRHADDDARLLVTFTQEPGALAELTPLEAGDWAPEASTCNWPAAWTWCANGIIESRVLKAVNKTLGERGTSRNWATLCKLDAISRGEPA